MKICLSEGVCMHLFLLKKKKNEQDQFFQDCVTLKRVLLTPSLLAKLGGRWIKLTVSDHF